MDRNPDLFGEAFRLLRLHLDYTFVQVNGAPFEETHIDEAQPGIESYKHGNPPMLWCRFQYLADLGNRKWSVGRVPCGLRRHNVEGVHCEMGCMRESLEDAMQAVPGVVVGLRRFTMCKYFEFSLLTIAMTPALPIAGRIACLSLEQLVRHIEQSPAGTKTSAFH